MGNEPYKAARKQLYRVEDAMVICPWVTALYMSRFAQAVCGQSKKGAARLIPASAIADYVKLWKAKRRPPDGGSPKPRRWRALVG